VKGKPNNWPYRLLALLVALGLWWTTAAEKREAQSEKAIEASVTYLVPEGLVALERVNRVNVVVRGSQREIRRLRPFDVDVQVALREAKPGRVTLDLTEDDVVLPTDALRVVSISPKTLALRLDREVERSLPVFVELGGEPAAGAIVGSYRPVPSNARVIGPESLLRTLRRLATDRVALDGHAFTFEKEVAVLSPDPQIRILEPRTVTVRVEIAQPPAAR
jgi:YbbR domain-containing protein